MSVTIKQPVGGAEVYRVSVLDREGAMVDLTGWTVTLKIEGVAGTTPCAIDADPHFALAPIGGAATATASRAIGYVEARHPSGTPIDGTKFNLVIDGHP